MSTPADDREQLRLDAQSAYAGQRWVEAERLCHKLLALDRRDLTALEILGVTFVQTGRSVQGTKLLREVLLSDSNFFDAAFWLGVVLRERGEGAEAAKFAQMAAELNPADAAAHGSLASCLSLLRQSHQAVEAFERAIELDPGCSEFRHNLGIELEKLAREPEAMDSYRAAIRLAPAVPNSYVSLGRLLRNSRRFDEAAGYFQGAFDTADDTPEGHLQLGKAFFDEGILAEAELCLRRSIEAAPDQQDAFVLLGSVLMQLGRFEEAGVELERAIELDPPDSRPYVAIIGCRRTTHGDLPLLERMTAMLHDQRYSAFDRRNLQYALGKAFDDLGDYRSAMRHFDEANGMMLAQLAGNQMDRGRHSANIDGMIRVFSAQFLAQAKGFGVESDKPIFIVGMIRSGTTLVEQIVSSHPDVAAGGEQTFLLDRYQRVMAPTPGTSRSDAIHQLASEYLELLDSVGGGKPRVTDKMPNNSLLLGLIHTVFPNARIIHCRRHPVDTCISIYTTPFPLPLSYAHSQESIVFYYKEYLRLMEHWRQALPPEYFLEVDYEELVQNREIVSQRMIEFCGLDWDESCLHHDRNSGAIRTPSWWQARQPVYHSSVGRWRNYEPWLGPFRELL